MLWCCMSTSQKFVENKLFDLETLWMKAKEGEGDEENIDDVIEFIKEAEKLIGICDVKKK